MISEQMKSADLDFVLKYQDESFLFFQRHKSTSSGFDAGVWAERSDYLDMMIPPPQALLASLETLTR